MKKRNSQSFTAILSLTLTALMFFAGLVYFTGNNITASAQTNNQCAEAIKSAFQTFEQTVRAAQDTLKQALVAAQTSEEKIAAKKAFAATMQAAQATLRATIQAAPCQRPRLDEACVEAIKQAHETYRASVKAAQQELASVLAQTQTPEEVKQAREAFITAVNVAANELKAALKAASCTVQPAPTPNPSPTPEVTPTPETTPSPSPSPTPSSTRRRF